MNPKPTPKNNFDSILKNRLEKIKSVLGSKAKEYSHDNNRYYNFDVAARVMGTTPEKALLGMMMKHFVSVLDLVEGKLDRTPEMVDEKCGDLINYICLLEGMLLNDK